MKSSIYISSERIEVVGYTGSASKVCVKEYASIPLPTGTAINGKIIDRANLVEGLTALRDKHKKLFDNPTLIVDGNSILARRIKTPKLSNSHYNKIVRDEFSDSAEEPENLVCDFYRLTNAKGKHEGIFACAVEKALVEGYLAAFKEVGIRLKAISIGIQAILNYIETRKDLHQETMVLNVIDGVALLSMIFVDGQNVFTTRARLYGDDPAERAREILNSLSGLSHFTKSQKFNDITHSVYLGLNDDDMALLQTYNTNDDMRLETLLIPVQGKTAMLTESAHFALLNTLPVKGRIDLLQGYKAHRHREKPKNQLLPWIAGVLAVVTAICVYMAVITTHITQLDDEIQALSDYLNNEQNVARAAELDHMAQEAAYYDSAVAQVAAKEEANRALPAITSEMTAFILSARDGKVEVQNLSFSENDGVVRISCVSDTEPDALAYAETLEANEHISSVNYTGFSYTAEGGYSFTLELNPATDATE